MAGTGAARDRCRGARLLRRADPRRWQRRPGGQPPRRRRGPDRGVPDPRRRRPAARRPRSVAARRRAAATRTADGNPHRPARPRGDRRSRHRRWAGPWSGSVRRPVAVRRALMPCAAGAPLVAAATVALIVAGCMPAPATTQAEAVSTLWTQFAVAAAIVGGTV